MPKDKRPRAETPKGFRDAFGAEVAERDAMLARIAAVYRSHGFDALETSAVETVEALGKFLPDVDRPNEGVFAWEEDGDWLALRYDLTAPLARVFAQHRASLPNPYRRYAMGPVWRNEKPGPGRFRQFYQCDADTVGSASVAADAEIVGMLCGALEAAGIGAADYVIKIGSRKILDGVLEVSGLLDTSNLEVGRTERGIVLRAIDKMDRLGVAGVKDLLGSGRRDESGDFTEGAKLASLQIEKIMGFVNAFVEVGIDLSKEASRAAEIEPEYASKLHGACDSVEHEMRDLREHYGPFRPIWNAKMLDHLHDVVGQSDVGWQGVEELRRMTAMLEAQGFADHRILIDPSTVRGLGYYTGPVFEAELTFETPGDDGKPRQFGSVAGGGRYDDLVRRFTGESVPATGVSIGVDRLLAALRARGARAQAPGPVVVTVMDRERVGDALALAAELRAAGLRAEAYLGNAKGFGAQMKYADKRGAPFAVIEGEDERARGVVQVKDLAAGAAAARGASLEEWRDRPAQVEVARSEVATHLRALLGR